MLRRVVLFSVLILLLLAVGNAPASEITLQPGQVVALARGVEFQVIAVTLPATIAAIEGATLPRQILR